ncbi:MAG: MBL fold metallo-hydrolase [Blastocatellia bacterium AA13]|nr:MAG: MBL fold metallo-hydrolase [Blastocatellia bacterium AA13]
MTSRNVYLRQNVMLEPLVAQWPAWSYLLSPAPAAMHLANLNLKMMQSFVSSPEVHIAALKNPKMRGGPFIDYGPDKVGEIKALRNKTLNEQGHMVELAEAIQTLDRALASEAVGYSMEPLYRQIPDALKGFVELVYDLNNHPSIRFIEGLLYKSRYYDEGLQSIALSLAVKDDRRFAFSTPLLHDDGKVHLKAPLKSGRIDDLFRMRSESRPLEEICELLEVKNDDSSFPSFFTDDASRPRDKYTGGGLRVRYFGHACILIESRDVSILCDPLIGYDHGNGIERYSFADLPEQIDYVLITHNHQDHCMFETLLQLRHKTRNVIVPKNNGGGLADPSLKLALRHIGFGDVYEIDEMESVAVDRGTITGLPFLGEHAEVNIRSKSAYLISLEGQTALIAADSNNLQPELYRRVHDCVGDVDAVFLGMECDGAPLTWLYGALLTQALARKMDQSRRFDGSDYEKAIALVNQLNPKHVYVYAMGLEPWLSHVMAVQYTDRSRPIIESNKLVEDCAGRGITSERLFGKKDIFLNR